MAKICHRLNVFNIWLFLSTNKGRRFVLGKICLIFRLFLSTDHGCRFVFGKIVFKSLGYFCLLTKREDLF